MKRSIFLIACLLALKLMVSFTEAKPVAKEKVEETTHDAKEPNSQENDSKVVEEEAVDDSSGSGSGDGKYIHKQYLSRRLHGHPSRDIYLYLNKRLHKDIKVDPFARASSACACSD